MTPLTLAWEWYTSGTLSSLFLYDALCEWADGDLCRVHWINPISMQIHPKREHDWWCITTYKRTNMNCEIIPIQSRAKYSVKKQP